MIRKSGKKSIFQPYVGGLYLQKTTFFLRKATINIKFRKWGKFAK